MIKSSRPNKVDFGRKEQTEQLQKSVDKKSWCAMVAY